MGHWGWAHCVLVVLFVTLISITNAQTQIKISPDQCGAGGCYDVIVNATTQCQSATSGCTILFVPGDYHVYFSNYNQNFITIQGIKGTLTFSGYGATIITHGLHGVFYFSELNSVVVEGLSFDMFRVPFTLGQFASVNGSQAVFKVDSSVYPFYSNDSNYAWLSNVQAILEYNLSCDCIAEHSIDWYVTLTGSFDESTSTYSVAVSDPSALTVGSSYIIRHQVYSYNIFSFISTTDIDIHDVNMYATGGMGFYAGYATSVSLNNVRVEKIDNRPMSLCADAVHIDYCNGPISITNSFFEGQGDDGLNIHADYMQILQIISPTEAIFVAKGAHPAAGDAINIRSQTTFQILQTNALSSINSSQLTYDDVMARYCPSSLKGNTQWCDDLSAKSGKIGEMTGGVPYHVLLQDPLLSSVQVGDIIGAPGWLPTKVVLQNNIYKNNRARGQLLTISNVYASNNTYDHQTGAAILIVPDCNYWFQSDTTSNMILTDNTFINVNYAMATEKADISIYVQLPTGQLTTGQVNSNITISNNKFYQSQSENAVEATATNGIIIENNQIEYSTQPASTFLLASNINENINNNICTLNGAQQTCATS